jgi:hypothetical protein
MRAILNLLGTFVGNLFKSRRRLEIENLFLRHQLYIALRHAPRLLRLRGCDRALLVWMTRRWPSLACVVQPETILRWHRAGFRAYWRWKSRGRPVSFPKIISARIRPIRQNQRMIRQHDACDPQSAWDVGRQPVQVAARNMSALRNRGGPKALHSSFLRSPWGRSTDARTFSTLSEMVFVSCITCWLSLLYSSISR